MMKPTLLVMAAGMGSRFGGLKQMEPVTESGEVLLDFSVHDALAAGFEKVVIVIKHAIERDFHNAVGKRLCKQADLQYVFQELDDLPAGHLPSEKREKPWGTGQAVLAARNAVTTPFAVINADDYYGKSAYQVMAEFLRNEVTSDGYGMVGYQLGNTLTEYGSVARGVCEAENGYLRGLTERRQIVKREHEAEYSEDGIQWNPLPFDTIVSMQLFGFHTDFFDLLGEGFTQFLTLPHDPMKGEYLLPARVGELVKSGRITMKILESPDRWFGVTYKEDKSAVTEAIKKLREQGDYPENLWQR